MESSAPINWTAYPALLFSGCIGIGILAAFMVAVESPWGWVAAAGTTIILAVVCWNIEYSKDFFPKKLLWTILLFLLAIHTGAIRYFIRHQQPKHHLLELAHRTEGTFEKTSTVIRGKIVSFPVSNSRYTRLVVRADTIWLSSIPVPTTGKLQVTLWRPFEPTGSPYPPFSYRQKLLIRGNIREVLPPGNPADFDYKSYLARRGIHFTVSISDPSRVTVLEQQVSLATYILTTIRTYVSESVTTNIPTRPARSILLALLLGDRSRLDPAVKQAFQHTGLMHLLAISGLHVMMIGLVFYNLLLPLLKRIRLSWTAMEWTRSTVTMTILVVYCLITGAPPSVVRALVMTALVLGGVLVQRIYHPLNALGAAAIVLLLANPDQLFDAGFQLSFAAVGGILTITPTMNRATPSGLDHRRVLYHLKNMLFASIGATLATMPVTLFHFGQVAFGGLLLNLLAIPITAIILSGAVTTVLFHGAAPIVSEAVGVTTDRAIHALLQAASCGNRLLSWTLLEQSIRSPLVVIGLVSGLLVIIHWYRPRVRWCWAGLFLLLLTTYIWIETTRQIHGQNLEVIFFDVGQGDAALVQLPNGRHFLIDGGNRSSYVDEGARTILPHLDRYGIEKLAAVVVSHAHSDHMGGLLTVVREMPVGRVIYNGQRYSSGLFEQMEQLTDSLHVPFQAAVAGDTLDLDTAVRIQVLAPFNIPPEHTDANEASVVLRLIYRDLSFLFTGDIERATERLLLGRLARFLPVDVVKVPHHGSQTSSTMGFVRQVTVLPDDIHTAIISVGRDNSFGLPDDHILERWRAAGAQIKTTTDGAIWLRTDGYQLSYVSWR